MARVAGVFSVSPQSSSDSLLLNAVFSFSGSDAASKALTWPAIPRRPCKSRERDEHVARRFHLGAEVKEIARFFARENARDGQFPLVDLDLLAGEGRLARQRARLLQSQRQAAARFEIQRAGKGLADPGTRLPGFSAAPNPAGGSFGAKKDASTPSTVTPRMKRRSAPSPPPAVPCSSTRRADPPARFFLDFARQTSTKQARHDHRLIHPAEPAERLLAQAAAQRITDQQRTGQHGTTDEHAEHHRHVAAPVIQEVAKEQLE